MATKRQLALAKARRELEDMKQEDQYLADVEQEKVDSRADRCSLCDGELVQDEFSGWMTCRDCGVV